MVKKGSVTIFLSLVLVLVMSFLFAMVEKARVSCMQAEARLLTRVCLQSVFGNYHKGIWEDYHLLLIDGTWGGDTFSKQRFEQKAMMDIEKNLLGKRSGSGSKSYDFIDLQPVGFEAEEYELATDSQGAAFLNQVCLVAQMDMVESAMKEISELENLGKQAQKENANKSDKWEQACNAVEQAEESREEGAEPATPTETVENPMDYVKTIRKSSVLNIVLEDPSSVSKKLVKDFKPLKNRRKNQGNWSVTRKTNLADRALLQCYLKNYFSNYGRTGVKGATTKALDYELEYVIGGKSSDVENLKKVVKELLGVREALNFATLLKDPGKMALSLEIATLVVGFTGIVPLIKAVQMGILLAWAYIESVLDVRALLSGKKIPFIKRTDQWCSDIKNPKVNIDKKKETPEVNDGLDYTQYLQMLLLMMPQSTVSYRCMDLIEKNEQVQMDCMLQSVKGVASYQGSSLFWNFNVLSSQKWNHILLTASDAISYAESR